MTAVARNLPCPWCQSTAYGTSTVSGESVCAVCLMPDRAADFVRAKYADFDSLANALASLPKGTLWCVGSMEDGPFARLVLPQPDGGYGGGYREAYGDTPTQAISLALASVTLTEGGDAKQAPGASLSGTAREAGDAR